MHVRVQPDFCRAGSQEPLWVAPKALRAKPERRLRRAVEAHRGDASIASAFTVSHCCADSPASFELTAKNNAMSALSVQSSSRVGAP